VGRVSVLEPLRRSTRNTLLVTVVLIGLLPGMVFIHGDPDPPRAIALVTGIVIFVLVSGFRMVREMRGAWEPMPLWQTSALVLFTLTLTPVATTVEPQAGAYCGVLPGLAAAEYFIGRKLTEGWRYVGIVAMLQGVVLGAVAAWYWAPQRALFLGCVGALVVVFTAYSLGAAFRQWEGALRLEDARRDAAELAATRERLRLAEDLHDILGHALEVVSLKSQLAVKLGPIDPERAHAEMTQVQRLAQDALHDVRALAQGKRPTDLATELAGARKLLASAGIECDVDADPAALTDRERELFGRVLREAVTNLLRHAAAGTCQVALSVGDGAATLRVRNDGAPEMPSNPDGTGLAGLARRVREASGTFSARTVHPGSFEVLATVPRSAS
jgi:two-component system sensor histidine kinase DesK